MWTQTIPHLNLAKADWSFSKNAADMAAPFFDEMWPRRAPHTVRRVALLDEPTTRGEG